MTKRKRVLKEQEQSTERAARTHKKSTSRWWIAAAALGTMAAIAVWAWPPLQADATEMIVYKSPTCGCCNKWIDHVEDNGFRVVTKDLQDMSGVKSLHGIKPKLSSCHTAIVDGYVIEGHVPAGDIKRLLQERPAVTGLTVPGMPMGSPGMEGPRKDPYSVLTFDAQGRTSVFSRH